MSHLYTDTKGTSTLILTGEGYGIAISPDAEALKASLLEAAEKVVVISDDVSLESARRVMKKLVDFRLSLEKSRKLVKEPVLALGKFIDKRAGDFGEAVHQAEKRIYALVAEYAAEQERKRREAEEVARRHAAEAERMRLEAARAKREAEEAAKRAEAKRSFADIAAEENAKEEAARLDAERVEAERKAALASMAATAAPVTGTKAALDYEVTDIRALYDAFPDLVELTPKRREILARLKAMKDRGLPVNLPGLRVVEIMKVSAR